ncbi:MAG: GxxExxY protein [Chitinophagales bacterium]|nr:GxxExxY protein [Chitinophagales bacterium]
MTINEITSIIIEESIYIHKKLGPGLLESVYEAVLYNRLVKRGFFVERQRDVEVNFEDENMGIGFRCDLIVENRVIVELKSVQEVPKVTQKIVQTYLRLTDIQIGLIINFNEVKLVDGLQRIANNYIEQ